jgi:2-keto-4-pentenoate hydratase/2-oxohepta-3-ene-1,7-dioic acid hydratase in catechol pathway
MRYATLAEGGSRVVVIDGDRVIPLDPRLTMRDVAAGDGRLPARPEGAVALNSITFGPAVPAPGAIYTVGENYRAPGEEPGTRAARPLIFGKAPSSVGAPGAVLVWDRAVTDNVDAECELAIVVGAPARNVAPGEALGHVFGYTIVNDVTARDRQRNHKQWFLGKALDGFCPMGPWIATADEVEPENLEVKCWVNGELRQHANTRDLIFDIPTLIATISQGLTLVPGDIISTGTPAGVGIGMDPPGFLKPGDLVEITITGLGRLSNRFA